MRSLGSLLELNFLPVKTTKFSERHASAPSHSPLPQDPCKTHFLSLIYASKTLKELRQIHAQIFRNNLFSSSNLATGLISVSSSLKSIGYGLSVFRYFNPKNCFIFNALLRGLVENSRFESCISHFMLMLRMRVRPDRLSYPCVLKSAARLCLLRLGITLHGRIVKCGVQYDSFVRVSLVDFYVKFEEVGYAHQLFDETPHWIKNENILLWNVLVKGFCIVGDMNKAAHLFLETPETNTASWNNLINGYMRNGDLEKASKLFDEMPKKDVVSWTTMVNGFSDNGKHEMALQMYYRMLEDDVKPNNLTIVSALSACAKMGALEAGEKIHYHLSSNRFQLNKAVENALIDMYAKCGNIQTASTIFGEIKEKDILTWTVMIWGWAIHGCFQQAILCFKQMMYSGIKPDEVVFLALLTACTHAGQVNLGLNFFDSMRLDYSIEPTIKHYALIVDLLGRAGRLGEAMNRIQKMPVTPDFVIWGTLFSACRAHNNIKMAELVSEKLLELEPKHPGSYVFLSNVYAAVGRWEDVERVRLLMQSRSVEKDPGWSYMEIGGRVRSFVSGDNDHVHAKETYLKLEEIVNGAMALGYMPETGWVLHNIEEEEKEDALGSHSEKLAFAFGLINTAEGTTIRIVKNLRVCGDCHSLMKYASKMCQREIVLRDIKRFHHFKNGTCSCGDYW